MEYLNIYVVYVYRLENMEITRAFIKDRQAYVLILSSKI
jgi:hypothetical protein